MSEGQRIGAMIVDGHSILRVVLQVMDQSEEFGGGGTGGGWRGGDRVAAVVPQL